jgi:hypothetical protein
METNLFQFIDQAIFLSYFRNISWSCSKIAPATRTTLATPLYKYLTPLTSLITLSVIAPPKTFGGFEFFTNISACQ